jgi:mono/diheme cytochrome c family protein
VTFHTHCSICHGDSAVGGGVLPDLRWSPMIQSASAWEDVVMKGVRRDRGMVSFAPVISAQDAEAVRAYVIKRANDAYPGVAAGQ